MYSREESQQLKKDFWIAFAEKYPRKWVLYDTKIKNFSFKFYIDNKKAQVAIEIEHREESKRNLYFDKIMMVKNILSQEFELELIYEKNFYLETGKIISRIWIEKENISINNRNNWEVIFDFFYEKMNLIELFYETYDDYIKDVIT